MILLKEIFDRLSGIHTLNQKLDLVLKQNQNVIDLIINHENRLTRLETITQVNTIKTLGKPKKTPA